ncbi:MAG: hypothetical protein HYT22_02880 [Candidatus Niyogibacteria bacterium]|nr:hypothetical protein [Candidatus Niyogibacteria bacterium]
MDQVVETIDRIPERHIGTPLLLMMASPLIVGRSRLRAAVMLACGVQSDDDIRAGLDARIEDLVAAVQLSRDGQCTFREALAR